VGSVGACLSVHTTCKRRLDPEDLKSVLRGRLVLTLEGNGGEKLEAAVDQPPRADVAAAAGEAAAAGKATGEAAGGLAALRAGNRQALTFSSAAEAVPLTVFLVIGANGMGKTTTIGKLANRLRVEGNQTVMIAACDTFRAAAVEQLEMWADRSEALLVKPKVKQPDVKEGEEEARAANKLDKLGSGLGGTTTERPAQVLYRALDEAVAQKADVLIVDTSGRLSNNDQLNDELKRLGKIIETKLGRPAHETLLVVDANIGRNAVEQAKVWKAEVGASGVIVTKLDGTARAGYVVGLVRDVGLPVKLVGVGEKIDDLRDFEPGP